MKELERIYELHKTYNKHTGEMLCTTCGYILRFNKLEKSEVIKYFSNKKHSFKELLYHFCNINQNNYFLMTHVIDLINLIPELLRRNKKELMEIIKTFNLNNSEIIEALIKNSIYDVNEVYENQLINSENKGQILINWEKFKYKKDFLKKYKLNIDWMSDITKIVKYSSLDELKYMKLKDGNGYYVIVDEYSEDMLKKLYFLNKNFKAMLFLKFYPKVFLELIKENRFSLLRDDIYKAIDLYLNLYHKLPWEDEENIPPEEKGFWGRQKLEKAEDFKEDEDVSKLILYKGELYRLEI